MNSFDRLSAGGIVGFTLLWVLWVMSSIWLVMYIYISIFYECVDGKVVGEYMENAGHMYYISSIRKVIVDTDYWRTVISSDTAMVGDKVKVKMRTF